MTPMSAARARTGPMTADRTTTQMNSDRSIGITSASCCGPVRVTDACGPGQERVAAWGVPGEPLEQEAEDVLEAALLLFLLRRVLRGCRRWIRRRPARRAARAG